MLDGVTVDSRCPSPGRHTGIPSEYTGPGTPSLYTGPGIGGAAPERAAFPEPGSTLGMGSLYVGDPRSAFPPTQRPPPGGDDAGDEIKVDIYVLEEDGASPHGPAFLPDITRTRGPDTPAPHLDITRSPDTPSSMGSSALDSSVQGSPSILMLGSRRSSKGKHSMETPIFPESTSSRMTLSLDLPATLATVSARRMLSLDLPISMETPSALDSPSSLGSSSPLGASPEGPSYQGIHSVLPSLDMSSSGRTLSVDLSSVETPSPADTPSLCTSPVDTPVLDTHPLDKSNSSVCVNTPPMSLCGTSYPRTSSVVTPSSLDTPCSLDMPSSLDSPSSLATHSLVTGAACSPDRESPSILDSPFSLPPPSDTGALAAPASGPHSDIVFDALDTAGLSLSAEWTLPCAVPYNDASPPATVPTHSADNHSHTNGYHGEVNCSHGNTNTAHTDILCDANSCHQGDANGCFGDKNVNQYLSGNHGDKTGTHGNENNFYCDFLGNHIDTCSNYDYFVTDCSYGDPHSNHGYNVTVHNGSFRLAEPVPCPATDLSPPADHHGNVPEGYTLHIPDADDRLPGVQGAGPLGASTDATPASLAADIELFLQALSQQGGPGEEGLQVPPGLQGFPGLQGLPGLHEAGQNPGYTPYPHAQQPLTPGMTGNMPAPPGPYDLPGSLSTYAHFLSRCSDPSPEDARVLKRLLTGTPTGEVLCDTGDTADTSDSAESGPGTRVPLPRDEPAPPAAHTPAHTPARLGFLSEYVRFLKNNCTGAHAPSSIHTTGSSTCTAWRRSMRGCASSTDLERSSVCRLTHSVERMVRRMDGGATPKRRRGRPPSRASSEASSTDDNGTTTTTTTAAGSTTRKVLKMKRGSRRYVPWQWGTVKEDRMWDTELWRSNISSKQVASPRASSMRATNNGSSIVASNSKKDCGMSTLRKILASHRSSMPNVINNNSKQSVMLSVSSMEDASSNSMDIPSLNSGGIPTVTNVNGTGSISMDTTGECSMDTTTVSSIEKPTMGITITASSIDDSAGNSLHNTSEKTSGPHVESGTYDPYPRSTASSISSLSSIDASPESSTGAAFRKPLQCDVCGKQYASKSSLRSHVQWQHRHEAYTCSCSKQFSWRSSLYKHMKKCPAARNVRVAV